MTSLLQPAYSLVLGSQRWIEQAIEIDLRCEIAPVVNTMTARFPADAPISAQTGDEAILELDGGEQNQAVFAGKIFSIQRTYRETRITALDAGGILAQHRPAVTFEQISAGNLIRNLCGDIGVEVASVVEGDPLTFYVVDPARNAYEHSAKISGWLGAIVRITNDGKVESLVVNAAQPELALRFGRELISISQSDWSSFVEGFTVAGESGVGSSSVPEAHRPTTDFYAGNRPKGPSPTRRWHWEPSLRTVQAAATAGAAWARDYATRRKPGKLEAFLLPQLQVGSVIEIQELPDFLAQGPLWVDRVRHRLSRSAATTMARFYQVDTNFDPMSLLGSAVGALGSLL